VVDSKHDVICIEAKKVFDFCFQEHRVERHFSVDMVGADGKVMVDCQIDTQNVTCKEVSPRQPVDPKRHKFLVCLAVQVPVLIRTVNAATGQFAKTLHKTLTVLKQAVLCVPPGAEIQCEVTGNCCCVFDDESEKVQCVFDLCIVVKSKATVQILVPTLGVCAPKECKALPAGCPPDVLRDSCDHSDCDD